MVQLTLHALPNPLPSTTLLCTKLTQGIYFIAKCLKRSLVPRPSPSFPLLAVRLQATGSWARAWERGYLKRGARDRVGAAGASEILVSV